MPRADRLAMEAAQSSPGPSTGHMASGSSLEDGEVVSGSYRSGRSSRARTPPEDGEPVPRKSEPRRFSGDDALGERTSRGNASRDRVRVKSEESGVAAPPVMERDSSSGRRRRTATIDVFGNKLDPSPAHTASPPTPSPSKQVANKPTQAVPSSSSSSFGSSTISIDPLSRPSSTLAGSSGLSLINALPEETVNSTKFSREVIDSCRDIMAKLIASTSKNNTPESARSLLSDDKMVDFIRLARTIRAQVAPKRSLEDDSMQPRPLKSPRSDPLAKTEETPARTSATSRSSTRFGPALQTPASESRLQEHATVLPADLPPGASTASAPEVVMESANISNVDHPQSSSFTVEQPVEIKTAPARRRTRSLSPTVPTSYLQQPSSTSTLVDLGKGAWTPQSQLSPSSTMMHDATHLEDAEMKNTEATRIPDVVPDDPSTPRELDPAPFGDEPPCSPCPVPGIWAEFRGCKASLRGGHSGKSHSS
ncbi:uncharacterized protein BXZ73DRAFT_73319 [Epithele typhae]|uniref:uncharacterized protein n=1 Tax=Epithele typhae TaxID=378194 RepID=UPI0020084A63|nr:uncharacterized protein BXZ73DRAFT_73319 [Epithele typhae]KAH9945118.1 hypothetical protein BXZ73DRAFT_73319 [Epithele typhae]